MGTSYAGLRHSPPLNFAVLLAAGASERMGLPKALLEGRRGQSFADLLARSCRRAGLRPLLVVQTATDPVAQAHPHLELEPSPQWRHGQLRSIRAGVRGALARGAAMVLVHPVDAPLVNAETFAAVLRALQTAPAAVPAFFGHRGHPVGLTASAARALLASRQPTLQLALEALGVREVPVDDPHVLENLNTPELYLRAFGHAPRVVSRSRSSLASSRPAAKAAPVAAPGREPARRTRRPKTSPAR